MLEHTTVFAVQGSLLLLLSGVILFAFRGRQNPENGSLPWLAAGYVCLGAGLAVLAMEHTLPRPLVTVVGNALLLMFCPLTARGLAKALGLRTHLDWYLLTLAVFTLADFSYFTYWWPYWLLLSWQAGVVIAVQYGALIVLLWRSKEREIQPAVRAMMACFAIHIVVNTVRLVVWRYTGTTLWFSGMNIVSSVGAALAYGWMDTLRMQAHLQQTAQMDPLTGLQNRRAMDELGTKAVQQASRAGAPSSALMMDLDRFKEINDTLGHSTGDASLCAVAGVLKQLVRGDDLAIRVGGDEFLLLLPGADEYKAQAVAQQIGTAVGGLHLRASNGEPYTLSVSMGCATLRGDSVTVVALMHAADTALYGERQARQGYGAAAD